MSAAAHAQVRPQGRRRQRSAISSWSGSAWGAIGVTAAFIGLTCWWLTQDRSIPIYDAGYHLMQAIRDRNAFQAGELVGWFVRTTLYPPLAYLIGALAAGIGGVNVASPIIGENLVFVPLLALGCYQTGRLLFGARAGLLAVVFVLGSPLLIAQFHVFQLDAPEAACVAVSMWLILASEDFSRTRIAGLAGLAVGCGLLVKVQFPLYLAGIVLTALARGGWRHSRGLAAFAAVALCLAAPWYLYHISEFHKVASLAGTMRSLPGNVPPTLSTASFTWYFWSTLNWQLYAPLSIFVLAGAIWTISAAVRNRVARGPVLELLVGAFVAWLAITLTRHHNIRYDLPLMPYLAVIGTGWIVYMSRPARVAAMGLLALAVAANTLAMTFGVPGQVESTLVSSPPATEARPDRVVFYSSEGNPEGGPQRDGNVPGVLSALRLDGVRVVAISRTQSALPDFSLEGLGALTTIAGLELVYEPAEVNTSSTVVALIHLPITSNAPPTCTRLSDGTGVWVLRLNPATHKVGLYCPLRSPPYYPMSIATQDWLGTLALP